jgi:hypothetical protein
VSSMSEISEPGSALRAICSLTLTQTCEQRHCQAAERRVVRSYDWSQSSIEWGPIGSHDFFRIRALLGGPPGGARDREDDALVLHSDPAGIAAALARLHHDLVLTGVATEADIEHTSVQPMRCGSLVIAEDAVGGFTAEGHTAALAHLRSYADVVPSATIIKVWS